MELFLFFEENRTCRLSQFRCGTGLCIDRALLCNGHSDCPDRSDELECCNIIVNCQVTIHSVTIFFSTPGICHVGQYQCASGQCVEMRHRCDGVSDCNDNSDEVDCPRMEIELQVYPERQTIRQGQEAIFRCRDEGELRIPVRWFREGNTSLPHGAIDSRGRLSLINAQANYSGVYVCSAFDEEQGLYLAQKAAYLTVQPSKSYISICNVRFFTNQRKLTNA